MEKFLLILLITICTTLSGVAQVKSDDSPKRIFTTEELQKVEEITKRAETYFREGEIHLKNKDIVSARKKFDLAVETILTSGLNIQEFEELKKYYNSLVEQIYKLEISTPSLRSSKPEKVETNTPQIGFNEQKFEPSPLDELAKLEIEEKPKTNTIVSPNYTRPTSTIITAVAGDTVEKIAVRYGFDATELARFNGLLPNSSLSAGRTIRIPLKNENAILGNKPVKSANGKVQIVMTWFQENLHDPYSLRIVRWSKIEKEYFVSEPYWTVRVRLRAKNAFGAYVLNEYIFLIRRNKIMRVLD